MAKITPCTFTSRHIHLRLSVPPLGAGYYIAGEQSAIVLKSLSDLARYIDWQLVPIAASGGGIWWPKTTVSIASTQHMHAHPLPQILRHMAMHR